MSQTADFTVGSWLNVTRALSAQPPDRPYPCLVDDGSLNATVLVGGYATYQNFRTDTWSYRAGVWTNVTSTAGPAPLGISTCAYDPGDRTLVEFGGIPTGTPNASYSNYTWVLRDGRWINVSNPTRLTPPAAGGADAYLAYDPGIGQLVLLEEPFPPYNGTALTWTYAAGNWTNVTATSGIAPPLGEGGAMTPDFADGDVVLFGGYSFPTLGNSSFHLLAGTWVFNGTTWTNLTTTAPPLREAEEMNYDSAFGGVLLFGGFLVTGASFNDSWVFSNNTWTNVSSEITGPQPATAAPVAMAYDAEDSYALLVTEFGPNETWVLGQPPPFARLVTPPGPVEAGEAYPLSAITASNDLPLNVSATTLPPGCVAVNATMWRCTTPAAGTFPVQVEVTDANGRSTIAVANISVGPAVGIAAFTATPSAVHLGDSIAFQVNVTGGIGPFTLNYTGLPAGCVPGNVTAFQCTFAVAGATTAEARVRDAVGDRATAYVSFGAWSLPRLESVSISPALLEVGDDLSLRTTVIGGAPPVSIDYLDAPPGCAPVSGANASCHPEAAGTYNITVNATDSLGATVLSAPQSFDVRADLVGVSLNTSAEGVTVGQSFTATANYTGGIAPFSFAWHGLPPGCNSTSATLVCAANIPGQYLLGVAVSDSDGHNALLAASVIVSSPSTATPALILDYGLVGAALVLAAVGIVMFIRRRRPGRSSTEPQTGIRTP